MTDEEIRTAVAAAIGGVRNEPRPLNFRRAHERSTAHRLAVHMERHLGAGWDIDCEYDRDGQDIKRLDRIRECDEERESDRILPDIIVHHRESAGREHNLLVVEVKKNAETDPCDHLKLTLMTAPGSHYQYQLGLYVNVDGGNFACTWYKDGQRLQG